MSMFDFLFSPEVHLPWFFHLEDYKLWAKDKGPMMNAYAYLIMVEERRKSTMLEF